MDETKKEKRMDNQKLAARIVRESMIYSEGFFCVTIQGCGFTATNDKELIKRVANWLNFKDVAGAAK
jgi:hypothetical protein